MPSADTRIGLCSIHPIEIWHRMPPVLGSVIYFLISMGLAITYQPHCILLGVSSNQSKYCILNTETCMSGLAGYTVTLNLL
jgi:hypothetical protein